MKTKLQSILLEAGEYSCLAQDYIMAVLDFLGVEKIYREPMLLSALICLYREGKSIKDEFFVADPVSIMERVAEQCGKKVFASVRKEDIKSYKDLPAGYACVRHDFNGKSHWVLAKDGFLLYDSLDDSQCVKYGSPATARIITLEEK